MIASKRLVLLLFRPTRRIATELSFLHFVDSLLVSRSIAGHVHHLTLLASELRPLAPGTVVVVTVEQRLH